MKIPFNIPYVCGNELVNIHQAVTNKNIAGDGPFGKKAESFLEEVIDNKSRVLLTTSCTHALEMAALLLDIQPGDEVIIPSFTFVSTAQAFVLHGAKPVFCDIRSDTKNIDETQIESLITKKTRAIVPVHYAGVACEMDVINNIAEKYNLIVIEDNAHGLFGTYKNKPLGSLGKMATLSFHQTKNIACGEGGALILNDSSLIHRAEMIREKGTNRSSFMRGQVDKYTWIEKGSSYVISDVLAAYLYAQLKSYSEIQSARKNLWVRYKQSLGVWAEKTHVTLPVIPNYCEQSYHMFYLVFPDRDNACHFIEHMKKNGIQSVPHYQPLHKSPMALSMAGEQLNNPVSEGISEKLVRMPFFCQLAKADSDFNYVVEVTKQFKTH